MKIDKETYDQIAELIHSDESPVGIDAKTHTFWFFTNSMKSKNDWMLWKINQNQKESNYEMTNYIKVVSSEKIIN